MNLAAARDADPIPPAAPPFDPLQLRRALGSFGTGVTVISTLGAGERRVGVTANSFNSVSLDPPMVLWSLKRNSPSLAAFDHCGRFVVHVLALDQVHLSRRFASPPAEGAQDKFEGVALRHTAQGLPLLDGCAAHFECRTHERLDVGDHVLFIGLVEAFEHQRAAGLLYCQGRYAQGVGLESVDGHPASQAQPAQQALHAQSTAQPTAQQTHHTTSAG